MTTVTEERATAASRTARVTMAFCVAHAPQIFLMPSNEDHAEIERVHDGYRLFAKRAAELSLDAVCIVALDHIHNHFLNLVPAFTVFTGEPVVAEFNGSTVECDAAPELANDLLDYLLESGFDPAFSQRAVLDHSFMIPLHYARQHLSTPVIPLVINAYVPPQPSIRRCFEFGEALASWAERASLKIGVVATGGMSHYPGTNKFHHPDLEADRRVLDWLVAGDGARLRELSPVELDRTGMVELRTWAIALAARGATSAATVHSYYDSGHCGYAVVEL